MWNLLDWMRTPFTKKEAATMTGARHHARDTRLAKKIENPGKSAIGTEPSRTLQDVSVTPDKRIHADPSRDVFSYSKSPRNSDLRRSAMAYWRKNTNAERPSDSRYYQDLTNPAGYNWQNPFDADAQASNKKNSTNHAASSDLDNLSAFITSNNKNHLYGMYAQKGQAGLLGETTDSLHRDSETEDVINYPHYQGGWIPESHYQSFDPELESPVEENENAINEHPLDAPDVILEPDAITAIAAHTAESAAMFSAASNAITNNADLNFSTLNSIESSPECDNLFAESAAPDRAIFIRDTQADQSITLDSLPEQQFVEVRISAADHPETAPEILRALAYDTNPDVRFAIAENHNVDIAILQLLAEDGNPYVAHRAKKTIQRIEGGQLKQGSFAQTRNPNWLSERRRTM